MISFNEYLSEETDDDSKFSSGKFAVPVHNLEFLEKKIAKLNKAAAKLGCKPIKFDIGEPYIKEIKKETLIDSNVGALKHPAVYMEFADVSVEGETPKLGGWSFIGKREPDEASSVIFTKSAPGKKVPKKYQDDHALKCDHCKKNAKRNETFIVKKGNKHMEVGRSCLKDFLGHANPQLYAKYAEALYEIEKEFSQARDPEYEGGSGRSSPLYGISDIVAPAIHEIKQNGFVSQQYASETKIPTSATVRNHLSPPSTKYNYKIPVTKEDYAEAEKAIQFMKSHPDRNKNEFWTNTGKMVDIGATSHKNVGYIVAAAAQYIKHTSQQVAKEKTTANVNQNPIANVGDKVKLKGEVIGAHAYQGHSYSYYDSGVRYILTIKTDDGHLVKMFTTNGSGINKGHRIEISGRVGSFEAEKFDKSPFKGMMMTTMAPKSRVEDFYDPKTEQEHADSHYHVGDKVKLRYKTEAGITKEGIGQIVSKPAFGKFQVKSLKSDHTITVNYDDLLGKI